MSTAPAQTPPWQRAHAQILAFSGADEAPAYRTGTLHQDQAYPSAPAVLDGMTITDSTCHSTIHDPVTPWMVPPQKRSPRTVRSRIIGPPRPNIAAIPGPPLPRMVPPLAWCSARVSRLTSGPGRIKLSMQSILGWVFKAS